MFVDSDVLRTELRRLVREAGEKFDESEGLPIYQSFVSGEITAYGKVEELLDSLREEGNEE